MVDTRTGLNMEESYMSKPLAEDLAEAVHEVIIIVDDQFIKTE